MSARSKARKRALDVLYESDMRGQDALEVLGSSAGRSQHATNPYTDELVAGVVERRGRIDDLIATYSVDWSLERMPVVDRNILRIGTWELLWGDVPDGVVLSEAVELASALSTDESAAFVNGVLAKLVQVRALLVLE